jgi:hypothetical protein
MNRVLCIVVVCALAATASADPLSMMGVSFRNPTYQSPALLWDINIATGLASNSRLLRADAGGGAYVNDRDAADIAMGPNGVLYVLNDSLASGSSQSPNLRNTLVSVDPATGLVTRIGATGITVNEGGLGFQPGTGVLYACWSTYVSPNFLGALYTINTATGAATVVSSGLAIRKASAMAFAPDGSLYILDTGQGQSGYDPPAVLNKIDLSTGTIISSITTNVALGYTAGMAFNPENGLLYVGDGDLYGTNNLYTLDVTTGAFTLVGATGIPGGTVNMGGGLAGIVFVPEPTTILLLASGLIVVCGRRR